MSRTLRLLFRRDPSRDRQKEHVHYEGYEFLWPDGSPVALGLDAFCKHGQRLLGLGRHLAGAPERLVDMLCFPLDDAESAITRLPGHRVRRFYLQRDGRQGRLYFMDGTPTTVLLDLDRDEPPVLHWIGLTTLNDGGRLWIDIAARPAEAPTPAPEIKSLTFGVHTFGHETLS
jgi:hypothetical protein